MSNTITKATEKKPAAKAKATPPVKKETKAAPKPKNQSSPQDRATVSKEAREEVNPAPNRVDLSWANEAPKQEKAAPKISTQKAVVSLEKELDKGGLFAGKPDSRKVNEVVAKLTPEQLKELPQEYQTAYDGRLDKFASKDRELQLRLQGKGLEADTYAIKQSLNRPKGLFGNGVREKDLFTILDRQTPESRKALEANLKKQGVDLEALSRNKKFDKSERAEFQALLSGDEAKKAQVAIEKNGGVSKLENLERVASLNAKDRKRWLSSNPDASKEIKKKYPAGPERDRALALLDGDSSKASAAQFRQITEGKGNNTANAKKLRDLIDNTPAEQREQLFKDLRQQTGQDFDSYLNAQGKNKKLEERDIERLSALKNGELSDSQRIQWALDGKKENDQIHRVLDDKNFNEVNKLTRQFHEDTGDNLHRTINQRFSGRDRFQLKQALRGKPETVAAQVERLNQARDFEREGNIFNSFTDLWTNDGKVLDTQVAKANRQLAQAQADGVITEDEKRALGKTTGYGESDVKSYQESKDKIAETASSIATTAAVTAVAAATGGAALPVALAATAAAGAGTKLLTKSALAGRSYRNEDKLADGFSGAVEGLSAVAGGRLGNQFVHGRKAGKILEEGNKGWAGRGINKLISGEGKRFDTARKLLSSSSNEAASGVITGSLDGFAKSTWDAVESGEYEGDLGALAWNVGGNTVKQGLVTGVVGSVVGGLVPGEEATEAVSNKLAKRFISKARREARDEVAQGLGTKILSKGYDFAKGKVKGEAIEKPVEATVEGVVNPVYEDFEEATEQL